MNISRNEVMKRKKQHQRLDSSKKLITKINAGLVLFSAGAVLCQLSNETTTIQAQSSRLSPSDFLKNVSDYARDIAAKNDLYASVMIAQAALESGWGNSSLAQAPNYNLFGIKGSYNGNSVYVPTLEDDGSGNYYEIKDSFRKYDDYDQSLEDYATVLTGDNDASSWRYQYYEGARYSNTSSYEDATAHLTGRYATDTSYGSKLNKIIQQYGLTAYDSNGQPVAPETPVVEAPVAPAKPAEPANENKPATNGSYKVKAGDSMYRIAKNHGVTLDALLKANSMSSYFIVPNQNLVIPGASTAPAQPTPTTPVEAEKPQNEDKELNVPSNPANGSSAYTVKRGDSLYAIANKHGITLAKLRELNNISGSFISPGQQLVVTGTTQSVPTPTTPTAPGDDVITPTVPSAPTSGYTVKRGDSLYAIASKHDLTLAQLRELNSISGSMIHPGQQLIVTGTNQSTPTSPAPTTPIESGNQETPTTPPAAPVTSTGSYTVKRGDNLYAIAQRHGITLSQLKTLNNISGNMIHPGQQLAVTGNVVAPVAETPVVVTPTPVAETPVTETAPETTPVVTEPPVVEDIVSAPSATTHTVQAGENLYRIAQKHGVNVHDLIAQNGGSDVLVGQVIELK